MALFPFRQLAVSFLLIVPLAVGAWAGGAGLTKSEQAIDRGRLSDAEWAGLREAYLTAQHAIVPAEDGRHEARNPGQRWHTEFDGRGFLVRPDEGEWTWGLELVSVGGEVVDPSSCSVRASENTLSYQWSERVEEWFINDNRGVEQGWTIGEKPNSPGEGLSLSLRVRGDLELESIAQGTSVRFLADSGANVLNYGGLKAWDAEGKDLHATFASPDGEHLEVHVDDRDATYPVTIDPVAQQGYLKASNAWLNDYFGVSVAISGDTAVVGAYAEDGDVASTAGAPNDNASFSGAAYVFVRSGTAWTQQAYLKASNAGVNDGFGYAVAIDGDTVVVGAFGEGGDASSTATVPNDNSPYAGAAYIFVRSAGVWTQQAYLKASNSAADDHFGISAAISGDTVVVGAHYEDGDASSTELSPNDNALSSGAAYVFVRSGTSWSQEAYLKASNSGSYDYFATSVSISGDTVVVGAQNEAGDVGSTVATPNDNAAAAGAAYVFVRSGTAWSQQAYLKASNAENGDSFGQSVGVDGETVVVGSYFEDGDASSTVAAPNNSAPAAGAAYVFTRSGTSWSQQAYLKASNVGSDDNFGYSVGISGDVVVVGARYEDGDASSTATTTNDNANAAGAVYAFVRSGVSWSQEAYLKASNAGNGDILGFSASVSGGSLITGALAEAGNASSTAAVPNDGASNAGAAYVFDLGIALPEIEVLVGGVDVGHAGGAIDFGSNTLGGTSAPQTVTVRNIGAANLNGVALSVTGANASDFSLTNMSVGSSIAPGGSGLLQVSFSPTATGSREAFLEISNSDPDENPFVIDLSGEGSPSDQAYLKAFNADANDRYGTSVAMSGDTLVVGAPWEWGDSMSTEGAPNNDGYQAGAAYVYVWNGSTWTLQAYLKAPNAGPVDYFGQSVAISGDTIVVGAPYEDGDAFSTLAAPNANANGAGAAYVYVRSGSTWTLQGYLKASNAEGGDAFGQSVGISGDTVVVGAHLEDGSASSTVGTPNELADKAGAAYVYVRSGSVWSQQAYLKASNAGTGDWFGEHVAIDGDTVVVGAYSEDGSDTSTVVLPDDLAGNAGAAYVFVRAGTTWSQQAYLKASNAATNDWFGRAVTVDGETIVVGAQGEDGDASSTVASPNDNAIFFAGAAYVFTRSGSIWSQEAYLKASEVQGGDRFGFSVSLDGDLLAVGANEDRQNGTTPPYAAGAVYTFSRTGTDWSQVDYRKAINVDETNNVPGDNDFGFAVSIWGTTVVAGAPYEDGDAASTILAPNTNAAKSGAAYVFGVSLDDAEALLDTALEDAGLTGDDAEPLAEPFGDGVSNLLKYAFNMNLAGPDSHGMDPGGSSGLPGGTLFDDGGTTYWRVEFVRRKGSGLTYTPMKSTTLLPGSFIPLTASPVVSDIDADWERVTYDEPCDPASTPKCFSHVEVTVP